MTQAKRKPPQTRKRYGHMEQPPDLIAAIVRMDFDAVVQCVNSDPSVVNQVDAINNNAMHVCISGGSFRVRDIMAFLLRETDIDLLHKNDRGDTPIDFAIAINDREAATMLYKPTCAQMDAAYPDPKPDLELV